MRGEATPDDGSTLQSHAESPTRTSTPFRRSWFVAMLAALVLFAWCMMVDWSALWWKLQDLTDFEGGIALRGTVAGTGADFDGDGIEDVLLVHFDGTTRQGNGGRAQDIVVLSGASFEEIDRHSVGSIPRISGIGFLTAWMLGPGGIQAVEDHDGDGLPEILVGCLVGMGPEREDCWQSALLVDGENGDVQLGLSPVATAATALTPLRTTMIRDVSGDGIRDFALGASRPQICCGATGEVWRVLDDRGLGHPVLSVSSEGPAEDLIFFGGRVATVPSARDGHASWKLDSIVRTADVVAGSAVGDADRLLILYERGTRLGRLAVDTGDLQLVREANSGWNFTALASLGDLDADGVSDVMLVCEPNTMMSRRRHKVLACSGVDGSLFYALTADEYRLRSGPDGLKVVALDDLDRDGRRDYALCGASAVSVRSGGDGHELHRFGF